MEKQFGGRLCIAQEYEDSESPLSLQSQEERSKKIFSSAIIKKAPCKVTQQITQLIQEYHQVNPYQYDLDRKQNWFEVTNMVLNTNFHKKSSNNPISSIVKTIQEQSKQSISKRVWRKNIKQYQSTSLDHNFQFKPRIQYAKQLSIVEQPKRTQQQDQKFIFRRKSSEGSIFCSLSSKQKNINQIYPSTVIKNKRQRKSRAAIKKVVKLNHLKLALRTSQKKTTQNFQVQRNYLRVRVESSNKYIKPEYLVRYSKSASFPRIPQINSRQNINMNGLDEDLVNSVTKIVQKEKMKQPRGVIDINVIIKQIPTLSFKQSTMISVCSPQLQEYSKSDSINETVSINKSIVKTLQQQKKAPLKYNPKKSLLLKEFRPKQKMFTQIGQLKDKVDILLKSKSQLHILPEQNTYQRNISNHTLYTFDKYLRGEIIQRGETIQSERFKTEQSKEDILSYPQNTYRMQTESPEQQFNLTARSLYPMYSVLQKTPLQSQQQIRKKISIEDINLQRRNQNQSGLVISYQKTKSVNLNQSSKQFLIKHLSKQFK